MSISRYSQHRKELHLVDPPAQDVVKGRSASEATWHFAHDPMRRLPVEVVALIFQQHILDGWLPLVLSSICRDWRSISFNCPSLWTHIRFGWPQWYCGWHVTMKCKEHLELTSQWLERSRSLPLHIEFQWPINGEDDEMDEALERELARLLKKFAGRWNILAFFYIPKHHLSLFFGENEYFAAPMLEKIRIELDPDGIFGDRLDDKGRRLYLPGCAPSFLDMGYIDISLIEINWKNLTRLSYRFGDNFGPDELIDVLQSAPNLETCKVLGAFRFLERRPEARTIRSHPLTHLKLETFSLMFDEESCGQSFGQLLFRVNFPSLRTLHFRCNGVPDNLQVSLLTTFMFFVLKCAASLVNLYMDGITVTPMGNLNSFVLLLQTIPNLQTLGIAESSSLISDTFFERFGMATEPGIQAFLPSLRIFGYVGRRSFSWTSFSNILRRMEGSPQDTAVLSECRIYLWGETDVDETLKQRLDALPSAEVNRMELYHDFNDAMTILGFPDEDDNKEFFGPDGSSDDEDESQEVESGPE